MGHYKTTQDLDCIQCTVNTISVEEGAVQCTPCFTGRVSNFDNTLCGGFLTYSLRLLVFSNVFLGLISYQTSDLEQGL